MEFEWDPAKAESNYRKHGFRLSEAHDVLSDPLALTGEDTREDEQRFVTLGTNASGALRVVVYTWREERCRVISVRAATPSEKTCLRGRTMKKEYDFRKGRRGAVIEAPPGKTRITIRIDEDVIDWFKQQADAAGGASYQALINRALRDYVETETEGLEDTLRRVLREELDAKDRYR